MQSIVYRIIHSDKSVVQNTIDVSKKQAITAGELKSLLLSKHMISSSNFQAYITTTYTSQEMIGDDSTVPDNLKEVLLKEMDTSVYIEEESIKENHQKQKSRNSEGSVALEEHSNFYEENNSSQFMEREPECPPTVFGMVKLCRAFKCFYTERFIQLNSQISVLNIYYSRKNFPKKPAETIPLSSIKKLKRLKERPCFSRKSYMMIESTTNDLVFCFYDPQICNEWMGYIKKSIIFCQYYQNRMSRCLKSNSVNFKETIKKNQEKVELFDSAKKQSTRTTDKSIVQQSQIVLNSEFLLEKKEVVLLEDFEIKRKIGSGTFGFVYLTRHKKTNKVYALKQISKNALIQKRQLRYALTELEILKACKHPFILQLYYAFQTKQFLYIGLTYCPHGTLKQLISQKGPLKVKDCLLYLCELILAIEHLHELDVIYRDLKPHNILIGSDYHIVLSDFGLSKNHMSDRDIADSFCGSPAYLSPELLINSSTTKMSDIYGIGAVFYEMVHGSPIYDSPDIAEVFEQIKERQPQINGQLPQTVRDFLKVTLQKDPNKRLKNLKSHRLFEQVNWKDILNKKIKPTFNLESNFLNFVEINYKIDEDYNENDYSENRIENWLYWPPSHKI